MEVFPSKSETTAASALLLLSLMSCSISSKSSSSYSIEESTIEGTKESKQDSSPSESKSCCSTLTSEGSPEETKSHRLSILALAAHLHDMKLKVVRRSRTKHYRNTDRRKTLWSIPLFVNQNTHHLKRTRSETTQSLSGESSSSTVLIRGTPPSHRHRMVRFGNKLQESQNHRRWEVIRRQQQQQKQRQSIDLGRLKRRAEAIIKFLSIGCASEVTIRQVLGDSPDTSKALRMLLKLEEIKRSGAGGPKDPFIYTVKAVRSGTGSDVDSV